MRPLPAVVIAVVAVSIVAAVGFFTVESRLADERAVPVTRPAEPDGAVSARPPTPPVTAATTPLRPRGGRVLSLAEAIKELDLIKPARPRLADDFTVSTPGGEAFHLAAQRGKVVMINFWATWCPPCLEEMPAMERLYRRQKDAGFTLIAVSVDTDPKKVTPFLRAHKLTFPVGLDPKMELANTYAVRALPSSFVVGRDGALAALALGPRHWDGDAAHSLVEGLVR
jgi:peroxiredoxin